jgi:DNA-binding phage protein
VTGRRLKVTNSELLKAIAKKKHITLQKLAEISGLTRQGLYKKLDNESEFKASEIQKISACLGLSNSEKNAIFFAY